LAITLSAIGRDSLRAPAEQVPQGIVSLTAYDQASRVLRRGIGLLVSESGDVLAPADLIDGTSRVEVSVKGKQYPLTGLIAKDAGSAMVLFTAALPNEAARPATVARSVPSVGDKVQAIALNEQFEPSTITATVKTRNRVAAWENLGLDTALPGRSLDSPVFNMDGELVGIVSHPSAGETTLEVHAGEGISVLVRRLLAAKKSDSAENMHRSSPQAGPLSTKGIPLVGITQGKAISRVEPVYPRSAKEYHITGKVVVEITIDETGNVTTARAIDGHFQRPRNVSEGQVRQIIPEFNKAAVDAAIQWRFEPTRISGVPVKVIGSVTFNFMM